MLMRILIILLALIFGDVGLGHCFQDNQSIKKTGCFSANYGEAREKFLKAANSAGAKLETFINHHKEPDGEPYIPILPY
jgi:hypothetical protein